MEEDLLVTYMREFNAKKKKKKGDDQIDCKSSNKKLPTRDRDEEDWTSLTIFNHDVSF